MSQIFNKTYRHNQNYNASAARKLKPVCDFTICIYPILSLLHTESISLLSTQLRGWYTLSKLQCLILTQRRKKLPVQKIRWRFLGKLIFVNELTSLCQAMLTTTTNLVSLVTHADTHDQDEEEKKGKADTLSQKQQWWHMEWCSGESCCYCVLKTVCIYCSSHYCVQE